MSSSCHCCLDPTRRLNAKRNLDEEADNVTASVPVLTRFDRDPLLVFDIPRHSGQYNRDQPDSTWYHNNETEIGKIFPESCWNQNKVTGVAPSTFKILYPLCFEQNALQKSDPHILKREYEAKTSFAENY